MNTARLSRSLSLVLVICLALLAFPFSASANHAWGSYHWARTQNPFNLRLGDNVTSNWDSYLQTASGDWSRSTVLDTTVVAGGTTSKRCRPTSGRVEVCNSRYGNNGWLGLAQIWASGSHITQGAVKMNDTYFNTAQYNTSAWRTLVMCQEVGHTFGLDHQDENFNNPPLGTCMDYTSDPTPNQHPNQHDYEELGIIYSHLDSTTTVGGMPAEVANGDFSSPADWGEAIHNSADGRASLYMREFAGGHRIFTFVFWAEGRGR